VIEKSGAVKYSEVVKVSIAEGKGSITVFPNPIQDNLVKVQLTNIEKGRYSAVLYNTSGQRLYWQHNRAHRKIRCIYYCTWQVNKQRNLYTADKQRRFNYT
jgi:hypothetical protein